jgi:hypothetical protein
MSSSRSKSDQLRLTGTIVLALGLVAAALFYWIKIHGPAPDDLNALLPAYQRQSEHEMGVQMGTMGVIMMGWQETLALPATQAGIIAAGAALFAALFFRAAWVLDDDERDRQRLEEQR